MKKTIAMILALALALCLLPAGVFATTLNNVAYVNVTVNADNTLTTATKYADHVTEITSTTTALTAGWYVVNTPAANNLTITSSITVTGDVHLILVDNARLTAQQGIIVSNGSSLTIYAQSAGNAMGKLTATGHMGNAGIGGAGTVTINGGEIKAEGGLYGAGIGGGRQGSGTVNIYGGNITATGGESGAGIGGGRQGDGTITVSGGTVKATGSIFAAGIGGGQHGSGTITISGGEVEATGGDFGAGIGGGYQGDGKITVSGGTVKATGSIFAAGIGGGQHGSGTITISNGTIKATGGKGGAGIGGKGGAGIGGGPGGDGTVDISGGTVTATGGGDNSVTGNGSGGAGIGGGYGSNGKITISSGTVTAAGGKGGAGIGGGAVDYNTGGKGTVIINGGTITLAEGGSESADGVGSGSPHPSGSPDAPVSTVTLGHTVTAEISRDNSAWNAVGKTGEVWETVKKHRYFKSTAPIAAPVPLIPQVNVPVYRLPEYIEAEEVVEDAQPEEVVGDVPDVEEGTADLTIE